MRFVWALLLVVASGGVARAQEPSLAWRAPAACPAREAWLAALRARVAPAAWQASAPKLRAVVTIESSATGFTLALETELDGAIGQRRIEAARCEELVDASALIVALAIDPSAAERASAAPLVAPSSEASPGPSASTEVETPTPSSEAPAQPAAEPAKKPEPNAEPKPKTVEVSPELRAPPYEEERPRPPAPERPRDPSGARFFVRPVALLDAATLPKLALGPALQAGVRFGELRVEAGVGYLLAQSLQSPMDGRVLGELRWLGGSAGACYGLVPRRRFDVAPCARAELGYLWGRGRNLDEDEVSGGALWLAFVPGVLLEVEVIHGLLLATELAAGLPLLDSAFTVDGVGELHESPVVTTRLSAGVTLYFE